MSTDKQNIDNELAMAILNGLSGPNACKGADERRRMIPLHIADQAVAACEKEIAALKAENARLKAELHDATGHYNGIINKLEAEVERLETFGADATLDNRILETDNAHLKSEVERLRKAWDAMADIDSCFDGNTPITQGVGSVFKIVKRWKDANKI